MSENVLALKKMTSAKLCAVVKADFYGHGIGAVKAFDNADEFAVSSIGEAIELCEVTDKPINILSSPDKTVKYEYRENIFPSVSATDDLDFVYAAGCRAVNVKVNSGMNRYGANAESLKDIFTVAEKLRVKIKSVFSHIYDISAAEEQFERYMDIIKDFMDYIPQKHILSSNFVSLPDYMQLDMVRPGIVLYGYGQNAVHSAVTAKCGVTQVREVKKGENIGYGNMKSGRARKIAVIGAGYADGVRRITDNMPRYVAIGGSMCPIVGQVCMDAALIDVSGLDVTAGDEVTLMGNSYGVDAIAASCGTINYEILTGFGKRVGREYVW